MSGAQELQHLIEALEQNRSTFGNAQYSFPVESKQREALHDFSRSIGHVLRASYLRIEEFFYDSLYWHNSADEVKENLYILIWAQVRTIYHMEEIKGYEKYEGYEAPEIIVQKIRAKLTEFLATLEQRIAEHPSHTSKTVEAALIEQVRAWVATGFTMWIS